MRRRPPLVALALLFAAAPVAAEIYSWVDEQGVTHVVDDPAAVPPGVRAGAGRSGLAGAWSEGLLGPVPTGGAASQEEERARRLLRGAVADLERGEAARAGAALRAVLREDPARPEAHWYMALMERQRGRYDAAEAHLESFLAAAGDEFGAWREAAQRKLAELADERRLADAAQLDAEDVWIGVEHPHFRVYYDAALGRSSADYAVTVARYLEEAYAEVGLRLGAVPDEPLGVKLYGKAAYLRAHRHRFSFQTVGFFDGRIHVVSSAHPSGELRALLFHEYTHAVFRERTDGDRPFWWNEGLAELAERASRRQPMLTRSERSALRQRIDAGDWIPLRRLAPSFSGLDDDDARAAYLISTAAAAWLDGRSRPAQRGAVLEQMGRGASDDEAFRGVLGLDTESIDAGLREWIAGEFAPARSAL